MQKRYFTVAGHNFAITTLTGDVLTILPNLAPFEKEETDDLLFEIVNDKIGRAHV